MCSHMSQVGLPPLGWLNLACEWWCLNVNFIFPQNCPSSHLKHKVQMVVSCSRIIKSRVYFKTHIRRFYMITRRGKQNKNFYKYNFSLTSPLVRLVSVLSCLQSLCRTPDKAPNFVQEGQSKVLCDHSTDGKRGGSRTQSFIIYRTGYFTDFSFLIL